MKVKISLFFMISFVFLFIVSSNPSTHYASADSNQQIPQWFRDKASLWLSGNMTDQDFMQAIHDLLTSSSSGQMQMNQTTTNTTQSTQTAENKTSPVLAASVIHKSENCNDRNFPKVDWAGCDMSGMDLNHANLSGANLEGTNLSHANLMDASLIGTDLKYANLNYANLYTVDMPYANLSWASLVGAHGAYANFNWATLDNANFTNAILPDAQIRYGTGMGVIFKDANLNSVLFYTNNLSNADFEGADLTYAAFNINANLTNANLDGAELQSADFGTVDLTGASLHCKDNPICK